MQVRKDCYRRDLVKGNKKRNRIKSVYNLMYLDVLKVLEKQLYERIPKRIIVTFSARNIDIFATHKTLFIKNYYFIDNFDSSSKF